MRHLEKERGGEKKVKLWRTPVRKDALNGGVASFFGVSRCVNSAVACHSGGL